MISHDRLHKTCKPAGLNIRNNKYTEMSFDEKNNLLLESLRPDATRSADGVPVSASSEGSHTQNDQSCKYLKLVDAFEVEVCDDLYASVVQYLSSTKKSTQQSAAILEERQTCCTSGTDERLRVTAELLTADRSYNRHRFAAVFGH